MPPNLGRRRDNSRFETNYLDPRKLRFYRPDGEELRLDIENDRCVLACTAVKMFPLSNPDRYVSILDSNGDEVGILYELRQLDAESRREIELEFRNRYFVPIIEKINSIRIEFGIAYWEVDTDKGPTEFVVHGLRDNVVEISHHRYIIQDVDANRFEIPDLSKLDAKSQLLMERTV